MFFYKIYVSKQSHGLRTLNEAFFHQNSKLLGLGRYILGHLGIFGRFVETHFGTVRPCPCFPLINHYFYKKLRLYIRIPYIYLGLGFEFEFGLQRIRDLSFVYLQSLTWCILSATNCFSGFVQLQTINVSILKPFGQWSKYISIKFSLHKHSENPWVKS